MDTVRLRWSLRVGCRRIRLAVGRCPRRRVPLFELDELSEVTEDSHQRGHRVPDRRAKRKQNDTPQSREMTPVPCLNTDRQTQADQVDRQCKHGQSIAAEIFKVARESLSGDVVANARGQHKDELTLFVRNKGKIVTVSSCDRMNVAQEQES